MILNHWSKGQLKALSEEALVLWYTFLTRVGFNLTLDDLKASLHQKTRTTDLYEIYFLEDEGSILCAAVITSKDLALYIEAFLHLETTTFEQQTQFLKRLIKTLKEREMSSLRIELDKADQDTLKVFESLGFERYNETVNRVKLNVKVLDSPRVFEIHKTGRKIGFIQLIKGIPYHYDNHEIYYKSALQEQKENWFRTFLIFNLVYFVYVRENGLFMSPILLNLLITWGLFFLYSLRNLYRLFRLRKQHSDEVLRYIEVLKSYMTFTVIFMLILTALVIIIGLWLL